MLYAIGSTNDTTLGGYDGLLVALQSNGTIEWEKNFGSTSEERFRAITAMSNGLVAVGYSDGSFGKGKEGWVVRLDHSGKKLWQISNGGTGADYLNGVARTKNSGVVAVGMTSGTTGSDGWVIRLDDAGNMQCK